MPTKPSRHYCFTHYGEAPPTTTCKVRYLIYQRERCPTTNKKHWQGYAEFTETMRYKAASKALNIPGAHLEVKRGTRDEARAYCRKAESRIEEPVEIGSWARGGQGSRTDLAELVNRVRKGATDTELIDKDPEQACSYQRFIQWVRSSWSVTKSTTYCKKWAASQSLNPFQERILEKIEKQNDRQITWVCDLTGNRGKTHLSKMLCAEGKAQRFTNGRTKDIAYAFDPNVEIVIFDFARSCEERINYQIIEDLKNGMLFNSKYESKSLIFKEPKIIIMANFLPDKSKLSLDRWDIINFD